MKIPHSKTNIESIYFPMWNRVNLILLIVHDIRPSIGQPAGSKPLQLNIPFRAKVRADGWSWTVFVYTRIIFVFFFYILYSFRTNLLALFTSRSLGPTPSSKFNKDKPTKVCTYFKSVCLHNDLEKESPAFYAVDFLCWGRTKYRRR